MKVEEKEQNERIEILDELTELNKAECKVCHKGQIEKVTAVCPGCPVYEQLRKNGDRLIELTNKKRKRKERKKKKK